MRERELHVIDGHEYEFLELGAKTSTRILMRILKLAGPGMVNAVGALKIPEGGTLFDADIDPQALGAALSGLFENMDEEDTITTAETLFQSVTYKGKPVSFETETFQKNLFHMIKVLKKAAVYNVGDFFVAFKDAAQSEADSAQVLTMSKKTGSSGGSSSPK